MESLSNRRGKYSHFDIDAAPFAESFLVRSFNLGAPSDGTFFYLVPYLLVM